ncbi:phosphoserine transaminase [Demequina lignilytica]|uniref:phosphoserine transaminase n=1 Tax=Demequina lignilytica TaxID=3051663 RepID=A0AB35MIB2_9MICO|nr:phosphoserine transaminase [Demequina sp. SYSU T0a273]MDN4483554.1 phosphoserine transaminase [Demequina sp. SYSU T0a273]
MPMTALIEIPHDLLPRDGRFGSGPSKVSDAQVSALVASQPSVLGTSHRQAPVKGLVGDVRRMLAELYSLPEGYEVVLGNGGSTLFWDAAAFSLVDELAQHCAFGEFGAKFAKATDLAPHLRRSSVRTAEPGGIVLPEAEDGVDVYAWPHNETSTGAIAPVLRPAGTEGALTVVDATSAAGGTLVDLTRADVYYFAPQKSFASDGGLWFAFMSPAALARVEAIADAKRWVPESLSLGAAIDNSRANQTLNTPAVATLVMMRAQLEWMLAGGGLPFAAGRSAESSTAIYDWAEGTSWATPFVTDPAHRSPVVATIDLDPSVDSAVLRTHLRGNGIVDIDPYRKLGRNQIRVGVYPAVDPDDVRALLACIDHVVERLGS